MGEPTAAEVIMVMCDDRLRPLVAALDVAINELQRAPLENGYANGKLVVAVNISMGDLRAAGCSYEELVLYRRVIRHLALKKSQDAA